MSEKEFCIGLQTMAYDIDALALEEFTPEFLRRLDSMRFEDIIKEMKAMQEAGDISAEGAHKQVELLK